MSLVDSRPNLLAMVDVVLLTLKDQRLHVALFQRDREPFAGRWTLPGGFVHEDEDDSVADTVMRVLRQKTGIVHPWLEQLCVFSGPNRDPRGWSLSVAHFALVPLVELQASQDPCGSGAMRLVDVAEVKSLPFDHDRIVAEAAERVRSKSSYSSIAAHLLPDEFTISQLHGVYQAVVGQEINMANFRRKISEMPLLEEVKGKVHHEGRMKPAQLFRLRPEYRRQLLVRQRGLA